MPVYPGAHKRPVCDSNMERTEGSTYTPAHEESDLRGGSVDGDERRGVSAATFLRHAADFSQ
jgi:hypothetical protein